MGRALNALLTVAVSAGLALASTAGSAQSAGEVNLYSSRHYDTDERLYSDFEKATGIKVNRIEADAGDLIKRIKSEGANSPGDVLITVDAGRLWKADADGLFQPVQSEVLNGAIPAHLRHPKGHWFAFSTRARAIFYDKSRVTDPPMTYEALADPKYKGLVCTRSSSNIYMLSLMASLIAHNGAEAMRDWAKKVYDNRARDPEGGDTDQLRGLVSGICGIALANTYYFARSLRAEVKDLSGKTDGIGVIFPNQDGRGAHVNVSGAGVLAHSPNRENAIKFLEYLASRQAQEYFAAGNDEYPVVEGVAGSAAVLKLGSFKSDTLEINKLGEFQAEAQRIYDEAGYK